MSIIEGALTVSEMQVRDIMIPRAQMDVIDINEPGDHICPEPGGRYRVKALTQIADFNAAFGTRSSDEAADTVGGLVIAHLGRLPKRGESVAIEGLRFQVLRADSRRVYTLLVDKAKT